MRLDKYLKVSRIFKRRTIAKEVSKNSRVMINDRVAKPGTDVKEGDILVISYGGKELKVKVLNTPAYVKKDDAETMYEIIEDIN
ncbi:MAG: RNA-binding S4 domain-containing protein [Candidatus Izemoplasmatales bacterium]|jgi:ribosomal 50S subunit-recycling heat shock protein|nr:RNA-binding S4 domain-containing protein [Candidatus Izemoplasmatales bacterium]MDD4068984.1 RNA-binding S4 domain-containing protein [Candidatus Izemoplasmatales bacterium]MDY0138315.1 RNA-binding S4 domain-containing protein [Candidatus Izemoplasmatales bacterium]